MSETLTVDLTAEANRQGRAMAEQYAKMLVDAAVSRDVWPMMLNALSSDFKFDVLPIRDEIFLQHVAYNACHRRWDELRKKDENDEPGEPLPKQEVH